jgi:D-serine deaminase-like pyridoxal phosphate-dependent protein
MKSTLDTPALLIDLDVLDAKAVTTAIGLLTASADQCRQACHDIQIVSCDGTGTFLYSVKQPGVTEVQVGAR